MDCVWLLFPSADILEASARGLLVRRGAGLLQASVGCGGLQRRRPLVYVCREGLRASAGGLAVLFEPCGQALRSLSVAGSPGKPGKPCLCDEDAFRTNLGARRQQ